MRLYMNSYSTWYVCSVGQPSAYSCVHVQNRFTSRVRGPLPAAAPRCRSGIPRPPPRAAAPRSRSTRQTAIIITHQTTEGRQRAEDSRLPAPRSSAQRPHRHAQISRYMHSWRREVGGRSSQHQDSARALLLTRPPLPAPQRSSRQLPSRALARSSTADYPPLLSSSRCFVEPWLARGMSWMGT